MEDLTILITGAGATGVYGVIKGLKRNGERNIRIIGVDVDPHIASRHFVDQFHLVPHRTDANFMPSILELMKKEQVDILFPIPTLDLDLFSENKSLIESLGKKVIVSDKPWLTIANNKMMLYRHLNKGSVSCVPNSVLVNEVDEFIKAVEMLGYPDLPVTIKKPLSTGAQGFRVLDKKIDRLEILLNRNPNVTLTTLEEILVTLKSASLFPELIVQEYLPGEEYDVDVLAQRGQMLIAIPRKNEMMLWGMSLLCRAEKHDGLISLAREIMFSLKLSYVISLTFKFSRDGTPKIIEINPRVPASIIAAIGSGVNLPYLAVKIALGERVELPEVRWGTRMIRYWDEIVVLPDGQIERFTF
jgi:carbamoyl-phosphate synthase large subunit